jgi:hypothetical protein
MIEWAEFKQLAKGLMMGLCECGTESVTNTKGDVYFDHLNSYQLLRKFSDPWH